MTPERIAQLEQMLERGTIRKGHIVEMLDAIKQRKLDHIGDTNKMVSFQDLAAELFVVAQISPADDGFSDTITRIEAWLRNHFSTPPQRKPLTDEEALELWSKHEKHWRFENNALAFARAIEAAHGIKENT